ncbi:STAS domain-containing protein [Streptomyces sp. NPDC002851]
MAEQRLRLEPRWADVGVLVIDAYGVVDAATVPELSEPLLKLAATGVRHFVVDLTGVERIDIEGLRTLIAARARLRADGGTLAVTGGPNVPGVVQAAGISRAGFVYASVDEATQAVGPS